MKFNFNLNKALILTGTIALGLVIFFWFWWGGKEINISKLNDKLDTLAELDPVSPISGVNCENADSRPVAVMISSDPPTRPLSGISNADIVFEMPVTPGGVTRMMAVFQCFESGEVGSIRSAREDFIPLASGLGAIYVHWGGEKEALNKLDNRVIDNIDAMRYETTYFYRKSGAKPPHDGFTDQKMISNAIEHLKYDNKNTFVGYPHSTSKAPVNLVNIEENILTGYLHPFDVEWKYKRESGIYQRFRGGKPEIDKNTGEQIGASVIVVMETTSKFSNKDYLTVSTVGSGRTYVYQNGIKISGQWDKKADQMDSKLFFKDPEGKEIEFVPGKIWIEIVTN